MGMYGECMGRDRVVVLRKHSLLYMHAFLRHTYSTHASCFSQRDWSHFQLEGKVQQASLTFTGCQPLQHGLQFSTTFLSAE